MINEKFVCDFFSLVDWLGCTAWLESCREKRRTEADIPLLRWPEVGVVVGGRDTVIPFLLKYIEGKQGGGVLLVEEKICMTFWSHSLKETYSLLLGSLPLFVLHIPLLFTCSLPHSFISPTSFLSICLFSLPYPDTHLALPLVLVLSLFVKAQSFISPYSRPLQSCEPGFSLQTHCPNPPTLHFLTH